jgi:hypothetical protein
LPQANLPLRRLRRREREILGRIDRVSTKRPAQGSEPGVSCLRTLPAGTAP